MAYELLTYGLKTGACISVFYIFFELMLSRETFHAFNRRLILAATALSFALPLCVITVHRTLPLPPPAAVRNDVSATAPAAPVSAGKADDEGGPAWPRVAGAIYLAGMAAVCGLTLRSVIGMRRLMRQGRRETLEDGTVLIRMNRETAPVSWYRNIVISERDLAENGEAILAHELAHIRLRHSFDMLAIDIATCLQWFNPAMWLLRRELRAIHEYEADAAVLASGVDAKQYQLLLIRKAVGRRWYSVANSFNHSKLKNRITMMLRKESSRRTRARALFLLPLTGLALGAFAETVYRMPADKVTKHSEIILPAEPDSAVVPTSSAPAAESTPPAVRKVPSDDGNGAAAVHDTVADDNSVIIIDMEGARAATDEERARVKAYFDSDEWKSAERKIETATERLDEYFEGDEWKDAQRKIDEAAQRAADYMNSDEWKSAKRKIETATERLDEYFEGDEWKNAQRKIDEAAQRAADYMNSDEWKSAKRKIETATERLDGYFEGDEWKDAQRKIDEAAQRAADYMNSDEWKQAQEELEGQYESLQNSIGDGQRATKKMLKKYRKQIEKAGKKMKP